MTIEQAIEKAIEGGWRPKGLPMGFKHKPEWFPVMFLDPLFWQSLGKGLGNKDEMRCDSEHCDAVQCSYAGYKDPKQMFDNFTSHIWYGGTPESFFANLSH